MVWSEGSGGGALTVPEIVYTSGSSTSVFIGITWTAY